MKTEQISTLVLAATLFSSVLTTRAFADCPQIEGKYTYHCKIQKDEGAIFVELLESSGSMLVEQHGCDSYRFENLADHEVGTIYLVDAADPHNSTEMKIKSSTGKALRFKAVTHGRDIIAALTLSSDVFRGLLRKTSDGFKLKGRENTRFFRFFIDRTSKFSCEFTRD